MEIKNFSIHLWILNPNVFSEQQTNELASLVNKVITSDESPEAGLLSLHFLYEVRLFYELLFVYKQWNIISYKPELCCSNIWNIITMYLQVFIPFYQEVWDSV